MKLSWLIQKPWVVNIQSRAFWAIGKDPEVELLRFVRGFPATDEPYLTKYRVKPSAPLIKMIIAKTKNYFHQEHMVKLENFNRMSVAL